MAVLLKCCFWAAAALPLFLGSRAFPVGDSSGEEAASEDPSPWTLPLGRQWLHTCAQLAQSLHRAAADWNDELCKEQNACKGSMEMLGNNLNLPNLSKGDGCHHLGFQKEKCLQSLATGLYSFQPFLEYIEETSRGNAEGTTTLWLRSLHLANTLKSMMKNPENVTMLDADTQKNLSTKLREQRGWNIIVIKHFILQGFTSFMEKATRAIRFL